MNTVGYFEIQSSDPPGDLAFYKAVFGWTFIREETVPIECYRIETNTIYGGLLKRPAALPPDGNGTNAFVCSVQVENFDRTSDSIIQQGGRIAMPKFAVPRRCWQGYLKYHLSKVIGLFLLFSCTGRNQGIHVNGSGDKVDTAGIAKTENTSKALDTIWFPFSDSSYRLKIHIFNPTAVSEKDTNAVITFYQAKAGKTNQIFQDSLFCTDYFIDRQDFNNDHVKDILVYNFAGGARTNATFHLYLVDKVRHKLTYVKGFEKILNPGYDTVYNIISSLRLSGKDYYSFYRINAKKKLISLGHGYTDSHDQDTSQYERAVRAIILDQQKTSIR